MSNRKFPENFSLDKFVEFAVDKAFELAGLEVCSNDFYIRFCESVSQSCGINKELVGELYNPLFWYLFTNDIKMKNNGEFREYSFVRDSPLEYMLPNISSEKAVVRLRKSTDRAEIVSGILKEYRELFEAKISRLNQQA